MSNDRYYHLDALRAFLMLLGVVIHAAFVYITERTWLVADSDTNRVFDYIVLVINVFRMPAFFFLSGYLFALSLLKQPSVFSFIRTRVIRLFVPLFTVGIILNTPQLWLFDHFGPEFHGAILGSNHCHSLAQWFSGCWVLHLWFLVTLFYFLLVGVLFHWIHTGIFRLLGTKSSLKLPGPESIFWPFTIISLAFISYIVQSLYGRGGATVMDWFPLLYVPWFFQYLPFFLAGLIFQRFSKGVNVWTNMQVLFSVLLCVTWIAFLLLFEYSELTRREFIFSSRYTLLLYYAVAFQTIFALIIITSKLPSFAPEQSRYFADISYTIYLVHHILVFLLGLWLSTIEIPISIKFLLVFSVAFIVSFFFHHLLVCKFSLLRFFFNGRTKNFSFNLPKK